MDESAAEAEAEAEQRGAENREQREPDREASVCLHRGSLAHTSHTLLALFGVCVRCAVVAPDAADAAALDDANRSAASGRDGFAWWEASP